VRDDRRLARVVEADAQDAHLGLAPDAEQHLQALEDAHGGGTPPTHARASHRTGETAPRVSGLLASCGAPASQRRRTGLQLGLAGARLSSPARIDIACVSLPARLALPLTPW
jgi:hypothetical protein